MRFMDALPLCVPATSLGDVYTLITCPAMTTHREVAPRQRERMGITPGLLRLSAGIEHPRDIIGDLMHALDAAGIQIGTPHGPRPDARLTGFPTTEAHTAQRAPAQKDTKRE